MSLEVVSIVIAAAIAAVVALPLGRALRKRSWAFYLVAALATGAYVWAALNGLNPKDLRWATFMFQKAYLGSFFLALVMFCGALPDGNWLRKRLLPIRGELSVLSFICYLGHIANYAKSYLPMMANPAIIKPTVGVSLAIAGALTVVFAVLGVTSFKAVRSSMASEVWVTLQKGAYLMVALLGVHVVLVLGLSLSNLGSSGSIHCVVYLALIALYAAMRVWKAVRARGRREEASA